MPEKHVIRSKNTELVLGFLFVAIGSFLLWDSWNNRGGNAPWYLQWFTFWG